MGKKKERQAATRARLVPVPSTAALPLRAAFLDSAAQLVARQGQTTLAAVLGGQLREVCQKAQLKLHPDVKRRYCRVCTRPTGDARLRVSSNGGLHLNRTCRHCGALRRFRLNGQADSEGQAGEAGSESKAAEGTAAAKPKRRKRKAKKPRAFAQHKLSVERQEAELAREAPGQS